jgi:hypothetical protein
MKLIQFTICLVFLAAPAAFGQVNNRSEPVRDPNAVTGRPAGEAASTDLFAATAVGQDRTSAQTQSAYVRPDRKARFDRYVKSIFGPLSLGKTVLSAGWSTWRNSPEEWGDNWEGFGRRVASGMGKSVIKHSAIYGLDEALKYDSAYYRSKKKDVGSRVGNALISPVTARDKNGRRVIGVPRIVGTYTASIVAAETWYPSRYDYKDGLKNGTVSLGMNAAFNLIKEFVWKK